MPVDANGCRRGRPRAGRLTVVASGSRHPVPQAAWPGSRHTTGRVRMRVVARREEYLTPRRLTQELDLIERVMGLNETFGGAGKRV